MSEGGAETTAGSQSTCTPTLQYTMGRRWKERAACWQVPCAFCSGALDSGRTGRTWREGTSKTRFSEMRCSSCL